MTDAPSRGSTDGPAHSSAALPGGDLFDRLVQRVFRAGMLLNGALHASTPTTAASIEQAIGELDGVLRDIRAAALIAGTPPAEPRPAPAELDIAVENLDEVAAAITRLMADRLLDGSCTVDLVDAAHTARRARLAAEEARSARPAREVSSPDGLRDPARWPAVPAGD